MSVNSNGQKDDDNLKIDGPALTVISRLSRWELLGLLLLPIALWGLWHLWSLTALLVLAVIVAIGLEPPVSWLEARGVSRAFAVVSLFAILLVLLASLGYVIGQVLVVQVQSLVATLPEQIHRWQATLEAALPLTPLGSMPAWLTGLSIRAAGYAGLAIHGMLGGLLTLLIALYLLLDGPRLWQRGLCLVPERQRIIVDVLGREIADKLRGYLHGVVLSGLIIGLLTGVGLAVLGVPYALLFGVLAGLLEAIPYLGPLLAAVGPVSMALTQSPLRAVIVLVFFTALQQIEDKVVVPQLQSHTTGLHPLTVILTTLILGSLFGLLGVIVAVPLAAAGQAVLVCLTSCFYHPEGTEAWLAERQQQETVSKAGMPSEGSEVVESTM